MLTVNPAGQRRQEELPELVHSESEVYGYQFGGGFNLGLNEYTTTWILPPSSCVNFKDLRGAWCRERVRQRQGED